MDNEVNKGGENIENINQLKKFMNLGRLRMGELRDCNIEFSGFDKMPDIDRKVAIVVSQYGIDSLNINIHWEDKPFRLKNFKDFDLFGYYSTHYCDMVYDDYYETLTITDSNNNDLILSY